MKNYYLHQKSHCEYPDWEDECEAENKDEAVKIFLKRLNNSPDAGWTADMIENYIEEEK